MKVLFIFSLLLISLYVLYEMCMFAYRVSLAKELVKTAVRYEKIEEVESDGVSLLVLGDSTAVGVGSTPTQSVPAYLAKYLGAAHVENYAVSGAQTADLVGQLSMKKHASYDVALIQIGANDIIRFKSIDEAVGRVEKVVAELSTFSKSVYVLTAGDIGASQLFPWFMRPIYHARTMEYHEKVSSAVASAGGVYVNLYKLPEKDVFVQEPERYFAGDGLHPSADGYREWFTKLEKVILEEKNSKE